MPRLIILTFVRYYLPGFKAGGPIRTVSNMVEALGDEFEFRIVCADRDFMDTAPYPNIALNGWSQVGKAWVYYSHPVRWGFLNWIRLIRDTPHDLMYLNSFFDSGYTVSPLLAARAITTPTRPVVLAPRGEFSLGALGLKAWKKLPFLTMIKMLGLYRGLLWHASTDEEAKDIRQQMGETQQIMVARNFPPKLSEIHVQTLANDTRDTLRVVFLSRITRMKNLDYALRVLTKSKISITFDIWGTLEDAEYWRECRILIQDMPRHVAIRYCGVAEHSMVPHILSGYDLLLLPTRGENYGHVIAEALSVGTSVLVSDQTLWCNLQSAGVGWDLPLLNGEEAFRNAMEEAFRKVQAGSAEWRQRILDFAAQRLNDPSLVDANRAIFLRAVAHEA